MKQQKWQKGKLAKRKPSGLVQWWVIVLSREPLNKKSTAPAGRTFCITHIEDNHFWALLPYSSEKYVWVHFLPEHDTYSRIEEKLFK